MPKRELRFKNYLNGFGAWTTTNKIICNKTRTFRNIISKLFEQEKNGELLVFQFMIEKSWFSDRFIWKNPNPSPNINWIWTHILARLLKKSNAVLGYIIRSKIPKI